MLSYNKIDLIKQTIQDYIKAPRSGFIKGDLGVKIIPRFLGVNVQNIVSFLKYLFDTLLCSYFSVVTPKLSYTKVST